MITLFFGRRAGLTLVELIMTLSIISILAALILPSAKLMAKRNKEIELRRSLRVIRNAIDDFKKTQDKICEKNQLAKGCGGGKNGCPESLDVLVEGFDFGDNPKGDKIRFLRRIPCDPFATDKLLPCMETWGLRAYADKPDSSYGGGDVYDVYSNNDGTAIDGTKYKDW